MDINIRVPGGTTHVVVPRPQDFDQKPTFMKRELVRGETTSWYKWMIDSFGDWYADPSFCSSCYRENRVPSRLLTLEEYRADAHYIKLNAPSDATHYTPFTQQYYKETGGVIYIYGLDISISDQYGWYHSNHNTTLGMIDLGKL